jgi:RNA polymerase sigma factor for flagellar operon FliA
LFQEQLATIRRAIAFTCRRSVLRGADAEDFGSFVMLKLIENDYATIRKFEGRCPFGAFISVVVHRMLLDYRVHLWGKWHASSEAKRLGEVAVAIESLLHRDHKSLDEAFPSLASRWPGLTQKEVADIAARLPPPSIKPRSVELETADREVWSDAASVESGAFAARDSALCQRTAAVVRATITELPEEERVVFRLRFESGMSVADIARTLGVEQKPLYRRLERSLRTFRSRLEQAGITAEEAQIIFTSRNASLDFGFEPGNSPSGPSHKDSTPGAKEDP